MSDEVKKYKKYSAVVPMSREMLLSHGLIQPTPEEAAQWEADEAKYREARAMEERMLTKARTRLFAIDNPGVQAVLALHHETDRQECNTCTYGEMADHDVWPCLTVHAIADAYEIEMP